MTERNPALWMQNRTDHTAEQERSLIHGLYLGKEGVMGQDDFKVVERAAGVNMSVDVGPGRATVVGDDNAAQGSYAVWNDAAKNVTLAAAHATNGRKDIIVARIKDAFYSGVSNTFTLEVITGTPAGAADGSGASDPAIPNNCLPLARVTVVATATSIANAKITDLRNRVGTMAACDIICTSSTRPTNPFVGMKIYEMDTAKALTYAGPTSGWNPPWNTAWGHVGSASVTTDNGGITSLVDLAGLSVTFTAVAGRRYRVVLDAFLNSSVGGDISSLVIATGGGAQIQSSQAYMPASGVSVRQQAVITVTPSAGSVTYKARASRAMGSGTLALAAGATYPAVMVVEDIGPAANPT